MASHNILFCFSCKRPSNDLCNFGTETDIDGIPFKTKLASFTFKKLEERCEKFFCKVCLTQISTTHNFLQTLFQHNTTTGMYISHELKKNPSTKLPMRISYGNMSEFESEQRGEENVKRQSSTDAFSKSPNKNLNLNEYFKAKSPVFRRYSSGVQSVYGSTVDLTQMPIVVPFEDRFTQESFANGVSYLDGADLSDKENENNSISHERDIKFEKKNTDLEVVDCSQKDLHRNLKEVSSTGRCRTYTSEDEDMAVVHINSRKRRAAYNLNTLMDSDEEFFVDDNSLDPDYRKGTHPKTITSISRGRRSKSKSPIRANNRSRSKSPASSLKKQCEICQKFFNKNWYKNHLKTHSDVFDYQCNVCGHKFKIKAYLSKHMKNHEALSLIKCTACAGVFQGVAALKDHLLTFHENVFRSGVCKLCGKDCKIAVNLNSHIARHHLSD